MNNIDIIIDGPNKYVIIDGIRYEFINFNITVNRHLQEVRTIGSNMVHVFDPYAPRPPPKYPRLHDYCKCGNSREDHWHGYGKCKGNDWAVGPDGDDYPIDCDCEEFRYSG